MSNHLQPLLLLLTCDAKNEELNEFLSQVIEGFGSTEHESSKLVKIIHSKDLFEGINQNLSTETGLKKLKSIMKVPKDEHDIQVYVLHDYPVSIGQFTDLINESKDYSIIDGVVKIVRQESSDALKSSLHGPETTITEVPPVVVIETPDRALAKFDIDAVIQKYKFDYGGLWSDITYDEFNILHQTASSGGKFEEMSKSEVISHLSDIFVHMCSLKSDFKDWNSKRNVTKLPMDAKVSTRVKEATASATMKNYETPSWSTPKYQGYLNCIDHIPRKARGVGAVLFAVVEAVSHDFETIYSCGDNLPSVPESLRILPHDDGSIGSTGEKPFHMLKQGYTIAVRNLQSNIFTIQEGDTFHSRIVNAKDALTKHPSDPEYVATTAVFGFERDALFSGHVPRLIGQGGMPLHASIPLKERNIQETELMTFTALSAFDFHRYNQLVHFNRMVERGIPPRVDFTGIRRAEDGGGDISALKRKYFKNIPAFTLPQIFSQELLKEPVLSREYYPMTDELLICFYWPPPKRRMAHKSWDPSKHMHLRPNFEEYLVLSERMNFTPRTAESVHSCLNVSKAEMLKYQEDTVFITPADKSVVLVKESCSAKKAWLTVHIKDVMFGLRSFIPKSPFAAGAPEGIFFLHTDDDVRLSVSLGTPVEMCKGKPDENGTVSLVMLFPNELSVSACSNGSVMISEPYTNDGAIVISGNTSPTAVLKSPTGRSKLSSIEKGTRLIAPENNRLICNGGCVVRYLEDGGPFSRDIYYPDGTRVLVRDMNMISDEGNKKFKYPVNGIMETILQDAPIIGDAEWTYVVLDTGGRVFYSFEDYSSNCDNAEGCNAHMSTAIPNISKYAIDAESEALVTEFKDGRVICISTDDLQDVYFPDGTRITTHPSGGVVSINRHGHPQLEVDIEVDTVSRRHSRGFSVPIAKGGDKTRTKIAMPDGTAVLIKYDTRVTSNHNGSIKAIRRDKSVVYVIDGGIVSFIAPDDWNSASVEEFDVEKKDTEYQPRETSLISTIITRRQKSVTLRTPSHMEPAAHSTLLMSSSLTSKRNKLEPTVSTFGVTSDIHDKTTKKKFTRRKPKQLSQLGLSGPPKKFQNLKMEDEVVPLPPRSTAAKYSFDLNTCQCIIEDHENNVFDIDLFENATKPVVSLAGEVDGLKPAAVAATNIEPRLFVVNRSADAIEICRFGEIEELEKSFERCPNEFRRYTTDVLCPPCNLGGAVQSSFFCQRKLQSSANYTFSDVFTERSWTNRPRPAALTLSLKKLFSRYLSRELELVKSQRHEVFLIKTFIEAAPLSDEGYLNVADDIARWNAFRAARDKIEQSFAFDDHRTEEEKKEESDLQKKLKGMYKAIKATKKKEAEKEMNVMQQKSAELPIIQEQPEEDQDEFENASREEDDDEMTPEEIELNDAFDTFAIKDCISSFDETTTTSNLGYLDVRGLQAVLIQVFNRFVTPKELSDAYYDETGLPLDMDEDLSIEYDMFRKIHYNLQTIYAEEKFQNENNSQASNSVADFSGMNGTQDNRTRSQSGPQELSAVLSRSSVGSFGSMQLPPAAGSGIKAVRQMSKTTAN